MNASTRRPNILLITTDEQRYDTYGAPGSEWPQPEHLSRLRADGVTLTNLYSNCPVCMPCRYTWLTGRYASQDEIGPYAGRDWPGAARTAPRALQRAGYHTAVIGKLHAHSGHRLERQHLSDLEPEVRAWGFDTAELCSGRGLWSLRCSRQDPKVNDRYTDHLRERGLYERALQENREREQSRGEHGGLEPYRPGALEEPDTLDGFVGRRMAEFIDNYSGDKPFFLHASLFGPHYPLDAPQAWFERHRPEDMPPPRTLEDPELIRRWQENRAMYMGLIDLVDHQIGRILKALERRTDLGETVVLFTTDHGDMLGDHGFARKLQPHEGSCRTPLIVRDPGARQRDAVLPGLAEAVDLPATILDFAGLDEAARAEALPRSPGRSLLPYLRSGGERFREDVYAEIGDADTPGTMRMLRRGDWKYARSASRDNSVDRLYDLRRDPQELTNLADDPAHADRLRLMQGALIDRMAATRCAGEKA